MSSQPASNIPLPSGTPPPPVFGGNQQPVTFSDLARKSQDVMSSTLRQYGPAMPTMGHQVVSQQAQSFVPLHQHSSAAHVPHMQTHHPQYQQNMHPQPSPVQIHYQIASHQQYQQHHHNHVITSTHHHQQRQQHQFHHQGQEANDIFRQTGSAPLAPSVPVYNIQPSNIYSMTNNRPNSVGPIVLQGGSINVTTRPPADSPFNQPPTNRSSAVSLFDQPPSLSEASSVTNANVPLNAVSPPLDTLGRSQSKGADNVPNKDTVCLPSSSTSSIEEPLAEKKEIMKVVRERCEKYALNELVQEYRDIESDMKEAQRNRATAERNLNEYMRQARGQNVEHQQKFIRLKREKILHSDECNEFHEALKYVSERLEKRFDYKIGQLPRQEQPLQVKRQPKPTARMGTTQPLVRPQKKQPPPKIIEREEKRGMLDIKDSNIWCKDCDNHYPSFKEFCDHLHKREHLTRCSKPSNPPWRTTAEQMSRKSSFDAYKSICHKLSDKSGYQFTIQDLDQALSPSLRLDSEKLKQHNLKRERGDFPTDDTLFTYKGYDMLIPITGYYCKLCSRTLCDFTEAEKHMKSFEHNAEHAKSVALNANHERTFRQNLEKSYKDQHGVELKTSSEERSPNKHRDADTTRSSSRNKSIEISIPSIAKSNDKLSDKAGAPASKSIDVPSIYSANLPFRQPYKKPTSKIVDEHDTIADKFEQRDVLKNNERTSGFKNRKEDNKDNPSSVSSSRKISSDCPTALRKNARREMEIIPLSKTNPSAALKRLRNDSSKQTEKYDESGNGNGEEGQQRQAAPIKTAYDNLPDTSMTITRLESSTDSDGESLIESGLSKRKIKSSTSKAIVLDALESDDDDVVQVVRDMRLEKEHKDSPFPELEIRIGRNVHYDTLKDHRLAAPLKVTLNRINLDSYKHMLLDEVNLWSRVNQMMTKKEPEEYTKDLSATTTAAASYFKPNGDAVPVEVDFGASSSDDERPPFEMGMLETFFCDK